MFNIDPMKIVSVVNGSLPKTTKVGWRKKEDGSFTSVYVAFARNGEAIIAKDGAVLLNEREPK